MAEVSIVVPAYNEAASIGETVDKIKAAFGNSPHRFEVIVVNDGSIDETGAIAEKHGATVISHPCNIGYGNSLLSGCNAAQFRNVAITDADGTYPIETLPELVTKFESRGLDMLVGARQGKYYRGSFPKRIARFCFKTLAEFVCGRNIPDINSGMRVMRRDLVLQFQNVLSGGFSFTTTITIISVLSSRFVAFEPIAYHQRTGKSHVRYVRDTLRSGQILVSTILLFNPIKLYLLLAGVSLFVGVAASVLGALMPAWLGPIMIFTGGFLISSLLLASAFLAEQNRLKPNRGLMARAAGNENYFMNRSLRSQ